MERNFIAIRELSFLLALLCCCNALELPPYTVVHSKADLEIRLYRELLWMSLVVREPLPLKSPPKTAFTGSPSSNNLGCSAFAPTSVKSSSNSNLEWLNLNLISLKIAIDNSENSSLFTMLYQYVRGANANSFRLMITAPILTTMAQVARGSDYTVRLYMPEKHEGAPPQPYAKLNLHLDKRFSGFAKDDNISKEKEALVSSLDKILDGKNTILGDKRPYGVAEYNASSHLYGRLNEVWIYVSVNSRVVILQ
ncbi:hypothetical protein RJ640_013098, partial [Escallonia rubra]